MTALNLDTFHSLSASSLASALRALEEGHSIHALEELHATRTAVEVLTRVAVRQAREAGQSWATIGKALGVTAQAAHKRYAAPAGGA